jgi:hypothetical protein
MSKKDDIQIALEHVSEAANLLSIHGAGGYSIESSALDVVFLRALAGLRDALRYDDRCEWYDPEGDIHESLSPELA